MRIDCKATEIFKKENSERAPKVDVYCGSGARVIRCTMIAERNRKRTIEESTTGSLLQNLRNMYMFRA